MDALVAYGSGSEGNDNDGEQQQKQKQASREGGDIGEIPVSETSTMAPMDLPPSSRVPLPLELNCEVFKCLKLPVQRKFIWGLGRDIYEIFRRRLLKKTKRVRNPHGNRWNRTNTRATISADGLHVYVSRGRSTVFAELPFLISGPQCRMDEFPGTICYYYEVKGRNCQVGLSDGAIPENSLIGQYPNSYAIATGFYEYELWIDDVELKFDDEDRPDWHSNGINVFGCGLVLDPEDKLAIFFTVNGALIGFQTEISPTVDRLFPTVAPNNSSLDANFGDDPAKPFEYDIKNCPGLGLACI